MSLDATAVRMALVDLLDGIDANVVAYKTPPHAPIHLPGLICYPPDTIEYRVARDTDRAVFPVVLLVGPQDPTAWEVLEAFMSGTGVLSIRAALYSDPHLGGLVSNVRLLTSQSGAYSVGTGPDDNAIGAEFRVEITA